MTQGDKDDHQNVHYQSELGRRVYTFHVESVPTGESAVTYDGVKPGFHGVVEDVQGHAESSAASADVDVQSGGTTVLDAAVADPSGLFQATVDGNKENRRFSDTENVELVLTTDGTGTLTGLTVQVTVRPAPMGGEVGQ